MEREPEWAEELDLLDILHIIRNRWWVVELCFVLAVAICAIVTYHFAVPMYRAETTLFAGKEPNRIASLDLSDLNLNQKLVADYREIILSRLVARQVIEDMNIDMSIQTFQKRVSVNTVKDSRFFKIGFESTNPEMAMYAANALGKAIIEKAEDIIDIKNIIVIDEAELPKNPVKPNKELNMAIAMVLGLMFGVFFACFMEFLDRTIKTNSDVEKHLSLITIGTIPLFKGEDPRNAKTTARALKSSIKKSEKTGEDVLTSRALISVLDPKAPASEAYRSLRTNIGYTSVDKQVKTIAITSPGPREGKSTTVVNLAISLAQVGKKVLVVDADLRKGKIHRYFLLPNARGVTDIIINRYKVKDVIKEVKYAENLYAICRGSVPPNPVELLESNRMAAFLEVIRKEFDIILIDTPPVGQLTDAAVLSKNVDGVILVIASGETQIDIAKHAKSRLNKIEAKVLGAVITKVVRAADGAYYYY